MDLEPFGDFAVDRAQEIGDRSGRAFGVGFFARIAAERGQHEHAARLWSAVADDSSVAPLGGWRRHRNAFEAHIRRDVGPDFVRLRAERPIALDKAVELALGT